MKTILLIGIVLVILILLAKIIAEQFFNDEDEDMDPWSSFN